MDSTETRKDMQNTGGRVEFEVGLRVHILTLEGKIADSIYQVKQARSDRKGHILLEEEGKKNNAELKVHHKRVIPLAVKGAACVIMLDRPTAICPDCGADEVVTAASTSMYCTSCDKHYPLHWLGAKPMAEDTATTKEAPKKEQPKKAKAPKTAKEPEKVCLDTLAGTDGCELYSKVVKFDHAKINATSHVLLLTGDNPRKLCFNLYNGALGRKAGPLPVDQFLKDEPVKDAKKEKPWFTIKDLDAARTKLEKDGYEVHGATAKDDEGDADAADEGDE